MATYCLRSESLVFSIMKSHSLSLTSRGSGSRVATYSAILASKALNAVESISCAKALAVRKHIMIVNTSLLILLLAI